VNTDGIRNSSDNAICQTNITALVGTQLHWSTDSQPVLVSKNGMASEVDGTCSAANKRKETGQRLFTAHMCCVHTSASRKNADALLYGDLVGNCVY